VADRDAVNLGLINGHSVGRILKEAVRRAATVIRSERLQFEAQVKESYAGAMDDVFTSADKAAQEVYLRTISECFPGCGVIGEEGSLSIDAVAPITAYFTLDPLDGTRAFVRRQSHGIATMVALVDVDAQGRGEVISAYIGDINSDEVYGYRPGSDKVHRITRLDTFETLGVDPMSLPARDRLFGLLRDPPERYSPVTQKLIAGFRDYEIMGSSLGTWAARLWKREVDALLLAKAHETPWDSTPVIGITRKLGFSYLRPDGDGWVEYEPVLPTEVFLREHDVLIIHGSYLENGRLKG